MAQNPLQHRHSGKTSVWNRNLHFATWLSQGKTQSKCSPARIGRASSLVFHSGPTGAPVWWTEWSARAALLGPCSGNFHCGTQLLIKGNYPVISPSQVWRCSGSPGHHAQQPFPGNKKPTEWKAWIKHTPCKAIKKSPYQSWNNTAPLILPDMRHKQLNSLKDNFLTGYSSVNILDTKTGAIFTVTICTIRYPDRIFSLGFLNSLLLHML